VQQLLELLEGLKANPSPESKQANTFQKQVDRINRILETFGLPEAEQLNQGEKRSKNSLAYGSVTQHKYYFIRS